MSEEWLRRILFLLVGIIIVAFLGFATMLSLIIGTGQTLKATIVGIGIFLVAWSAVVAFIYRTRPYHGLF